MSRVLVVGAGVVGLSCAVRLLESGHRVDVVGRDLPLESTSSVAAALWYPYLAFPQDRVRAWGARTYDTLRPLAKDERTGVSMLPGTEVLDLPAGEPWWASAVPDLTAAQVPGWAEARSFTAPVVDMPVYLRWLLGRIEELGGTVTRMNLSRLPDPGHPVVNASAIGSRLLAGDRTVQPVRGQVVVVEQWGLRRWWLHSAGPTYVVPRRHEVVIGGTEERDDWSRTPADETAEAILARAAELVPEVGRARVLRNKVGLRPARPEVRVEREGHVVHCYGHGGAGVTLSWGCADEVVELLG